MEHETTVLLKNLVALLVTGRTNEILARGENGRLSALEIQAAISNYPGNLTLPPDSAFGEASVYEIHNVNNDARLIEFDLWYDDLASDLTLSVEVKKNNEGKYVISIDDIHML